MASSALSIVSNYNAQVATNRLSRAHGRALDSVSRLSHGKRVESASDSSASVAISSTLSAHIGSFHQARTNIDSATVMLQTAEDGYQQISDILVEMRTLAIQGASNHLSETERDQLDTVFSQFKDQVDRISATTEYNGSNLLDGTAGDGGKMQFMMGIRNTSDSKLKVRFVEQSISSLKLGPSSVATRNDARKAVERIDSSLENLYEDRAKLGGHLSTLEQARNRVVSNTMELQDGLGGVRDLDMSAESSNLARQQVLKEAGAAMLVQANAQASMALRLVG